MSPSDYLILFYSIIAALTTIVYVQKWGELIQNRRYAIYYFVPLLWSVGFFLMLINEWFASFHWKADTNSFIFLMSLLVPFLLYFIGMLIFPTTDMLDKKDKYAYLDYFEHFRQQKTLIMCLGLVVFMLHVWGAWYNSPLEMDIFNGFWQLLWYKRNYLVLISLVLGLFVESKWLLFPIGLIIIYVWATTWVYTYIQ